MQYQYSVFLHKHILSITYNNYLLYTAPCISIRNLTIKDILHMATSVDQDPANSLLPRKSMKIVKDSEVFLKYHFVNPIYIHSVGIDNYKNIAKYEVLNLNLVSLLFIY